jgi:hypothetical protein
MCDIGELHNTLSQSAYDELLSATINKWKVDIELKSFVEYFQRQWTKSKFCNWQLFKTAACVVTQSSLPGLVQMPKKFRIVRRKKIRQYRDDSRDEEQMVAERDEPITVHVVVAEVDVVPVAVAEAVHEAEAIVQIAPKKRGRKPKVINATENASQMG